MYVLLLGLILFLSPAYLIYDETFLFDNIALIDQYGLSQEFLRALYQFQGPLYQVLHYAFHGLTDYQAIPMRLLNFVLFLIGLFLLYRTFQELKIKSPTYFTLLALSIPACWTFAGMALSETPAIFFATGSMLFLFYSRSAPTRKP